MEKKDKKTCKCDQYLDGWKRAKADFLNYKKGEENRIQDRVGYSNQKMILNIILILDNIYILENNIPKDLESNEWIQGFLQVKNQILNFLKEYNVKEIQGVGEQFDPQFHEAVEMIEDKSESGAIIEERQKGYTINDKVIRASKVIISK